MFPTKRTRLDRLFGFVTAAAGVACATSASAEPTTVPPLAPSPSLAACTVHGSSRVMASKVAPRAGLEAEADSGRVWLRFAHKANEPLLALAVEPDSLAVATTGVLSAPRFDEKTLLTRADFRQARWETSAWEHEAAGRPSVLESGDVRVTGPVVAKVDDKRSIWAWTVGSIYTGMDVRVLTVGPHGEALGTAVTLSHEGSAMGLPAVAVASSGRGVVAFVESNDQAFQVVAASLDCGAPATEPATPSWAMRTSP